MRVGAVGGGAEAKKISNFRLENGLDVVVIEDHRAPVVVHMLWYRAGSADEIPGSSGVAHFLEHLLFKKPNFWPRESFRGSLRKMVAVTMRLPAPIIPLIFNAWPVIVCRL